MPAVRESANVDREGIRDCSGKSLRALEKQDKKASMQIGRVCSRARWPGGTKGQWAGQDMQHAARVPSQCMALGETESVCHSECSTSISVRNVYVERLSSSFPKFVVLTFGSSFKTLNVELERPCQPLQLHGAADDFPRQPPLFRSSDDTAVIHTCPERRPSSQASNSSNHAVAASRTMFGRIWKQYARVASCWPSGNWCRYRTCCTNDFFVHSQKGKEIETQTLCIR